MKYSKYDHIQEVIQKRWEQGVLEQPGRKAELMWMSVYRQQYYFYCQDIVQREEFQPDQMSGQYRPALSPREPKCWTQSLRLGISRQESISPNKLGTEPQE